jgi:uncharacterized protein (TIGR02145 family)
MQTGTIRRISVLPGFLFILICLSGCEAFDREPPEGSFKTAPYVGDSSTVFLFDASGVTDNATPAWQLRVRWDYNGDGTWETDWSINKKGAWRFASDGLYTVACEVTDFTGNTTLAKDTVWVRPVHGDSLLTDTRDGHVYGTVLLYDRWWMAENLAYGSAIAGVRYPEDNGTTEYFAKPDSLLYGGYYTWSEVTDYGKDTTRGICPEGWRLPRPDDIKLLNDLGFIRDTIDHYLFSDGILGTRFLLSGRYLAYPPCGTVRAGFSVSGSAVAHSRSNTEPGPAGTGSTIRTDFIFYMTATPGSSSTRNGTRTGAGPVIRMWPCRCDV